MHVFLVNSNENDNLPILDSMRAIALVLAPAYTSLIFFVIGKAKLCTLIRRSPETKYLYVLVYRANNRQFPL